MNIGNIVILEGEKFIIQWIYESGYCEIKLLEGHRIELVPVSEVKYSRIKKTLGNTKK